MMKHWKDVAIAKIRGRGTKRDRGYYVSHFTTSELRRMLREAKDRSTRAEGDIYVIQEISAALTRREWDEL
jgi:hypothetical protein